MTRARYARYVLLRLAEALAVAGGAAALAHVLQRHAVLAPFSWPLPALPGAGHSAWARALGVAAWCAWPAAWAAAAHLVLGPKQKRPVYLRIPGAMYAYAGVAVSRDGGCRGGLVTGSTGSGKTLSCILPRLHSLCINESGVERPGWGASPAAGELERARRAYRDCARNTRGEITRLGAGRVQGDQRIERLRWQLEARAQALQGVADGCRRARYRIPPWGGFVCGEKGNEWQAIEALLGHHGREEDLCLLRTRPPAAPADWRPNVRLNLLSLGGVPADTYAKMIVDTGLAVEEAAARDEFFIPQARDKIAWGIRLIRAVHDAGRSPGPEPSRRGAHPGLLTLLDILTVQEGYRQYLIRSEREQPGLAASGAFAEARYQLENNYWSQPPDQLGGVRGTVYNFLVPFAERDIAEVFCADSTFDLRDIQQGKVVCLAIPQRFALQRRYVATLIKTLAYQVVLERFDGRQDHPDWRDRNVILVEQDEWQRHAVRDDCGVDVVREARGAVYAATQSQNAVWLKLGGRDRAAPLIANLRNRWICQAATDECAAESSGVISSRLARAVSFSSGDAGRTTSVSFAEAPFVPAHELRILPPFQVLFAPAEGPWLYRRCIAMPATPDGRIPPWWFGDWNPLHWVARAVGLPELLAGLRLHGGASQVPPWRARAPWRAQLRFIAGLDGTFIVLGQARSAAGRGRR